MQPVENSLAAPQKVKHTHNPSPTFRCLSTQEKRQVTTQERAHRFPAASQRAEEEGPTQVSINRICLSRIGVDGVSATRSDTHSCHGMTLGTDAQ